MNHAWRMDREFYALKYGRPDFSKKEDILKFMKTEKEVTIMWNMAHWMYYSIWKRGSWTDGDHYQRTFKSIEYGIKKKDYDSAAHYITNLYQDFRKYHPFNYGGERGGEGTLTRLYDLLDAINNG